MMHHGSTRAVPGAIGSAELLRTALVDGDAQALVGPTFRRATTIADAEALSDTIEVARLTARIGFTAADFDRYCAAFTATNPTTVLAQWAETETRPRMRRALAAALLAIEEEL